MAWPLNYCTPVEGFHTAGTALPSNHDRWKEKDRYDLPTCGAPTVPLLPSRWKSSSLLPSHSLLHQTKKKFTLHTAILTLIPHNQPRLRIWCFKKRSKMQIFCSDTTYRCHSFLYLSSNPESFHDS